jgi:VWFA-related protein
MNIARLHGVLALSIVALAQEKPDEPVVFRSDVSLARVDAQVLDRNRRPITTLRKEDFVLRAAGEERDISNFAREEVPLDVLILLDVSGSMRSHVELMAQATREALLVLSRKDRVAIMVFDRRTRLSMGFRGDHDGIVAGMNRVLEDEDFNGGTDITRALYDASAYMKTSARREARRAIVILTDDRTERDRDVAGVSRALEEANTILSALITPDAVGSGGGIRIPTGRNGGIFDDIIFGRRMPRGGRFPGGGPMGGGLQSAGTEQIARNSGGDSMEAADPSALEAALEKIRQSYALYFNAPNGARGVEVALTPEAARRYPGAQVNYRRNYQGSDASSGADEVPPPVVSERRRSPAPPVASDTTNTDDADIPPDPPAKRRRPGVDEPSSTKSAADSPKTGSADGGSEKGGFRRLKPGEKP